MSDPLLTAKLVAPFDVTEAYREIAQDLGKLAETTFRRRTVKVRTRILRIVKVKPGNVYYPIAWKSRKQQKAFFASDGFGAGIPTVRTDSYIDAFEVEIVTAGFAGQVILINDDPAAPYVGGDQQQPFHINTGWPNITAAMDAEQESVEAEYTNDYWLLAEPEALTR